MAVAELEKLAEDERPEFLRLYHTPFYELTLEDQERLQGFTSRIDFQRYAFEVKREEAANPHELACTVTSREPYQLQTVYGGLDLPEELVPPELRNSPGDDYHQDTLFATISADLDTGRVTSFVFGEYLRKATAKELAQVPTLDSLPKGNWPKR